MKVSFIYSRPNNPLGLIAVTIKRIRKSIASLYSNDMKPATVDSRNPNM